MEYGALFYFIGLAVFVATLLVVLASVLALQYPDQEKLSAYECGFDPVGDARQQFEVQFFLVGILFLVFDLEIAFLFPWSIAMGRIVVSGFFFVLFFLFILTLGLVYEWLKGGLDWQ